MKLRKSIKLPYEFLKLHLKPTRIKRTKIKKIEESARGIFLISTTTGLYLLEFDTIYRLLKGNCFGLTKSDNKIFIYQSFGPRGRIIQFSISKDHQISAEGQVWRKDLPGGCHQIDCVDDDLFVIDTYNNRILQYGINNHHKNEYYPLGELSNGRKSENYAHINSIFRCDNDQCYYLLCHNETTKTNRNSSILVVNENFDKISEIQTKSGDAHNIVKLNGNLLYCDSLGMTLNKDHEVVFKADYMTRGLSITNEVILLGGSEFAPREKRDKSKGHLYILNHNFQLITSTDFPGPVREIRRLDGIDYGMSCSNIKSK